MLWMRSRITSRSPHRGKLSAVPRRKEDADVLTRSGLIVGLIVVMVLFLAANPRAEDWREIIGTPGLSYDPGSAVYDAKKDHVYVRTKPRGMKPRWDSFSCSRYAWWMSFDDGNTWTGERPMEPGAFNDFREMLCAKKRSLPVYEGR